MGICHTCVDNGPVLRSILFKKKKRHFLFHFVYFSTIWSVHDFAACFLLKLEIATLLPSPHSFRSTSITGYYSCNYYVHSCTVLLILKYNVIVREKTWKSKRWSTTAASWPNRMDGHCSSSDDIVATDYMRQSIYLGGAVIIILSFPSPLKKILKGLSQILFTVTILT